ncbi:CheR family methyltransferase [Solimonas flava]|uniref:CheR family methyltransferase n=1 Tax=Solimonas flava TaxID=415849 RepID=UPI0004090885|nr:CheR family methyltransferase [Solimonas flava]
MPEPVTAADEAREFAFTARDFERVCAMIRARAGIALAPSKRDMVYSRLSRRLRALRLDSFAAYLQLLDEPRHPEWEAFTNALTTNLTAFFREPHHFETLQTLLREARGPRPLLLWSAAASTGEEPYSIAISACEAFGTLRPPVRILATDLDTQVLQTAERGVYPLERIERLDAARRQRFFRRGVGSREGYCRVVDELRALVHFRPLNLLDERWPLRGPYTAIFCRNVMIYFDRPTQHRVLSHLVPLLADDGLLFAGHSESFFHAAELVRPCGRTVYRRA